jgi:hypothetical protein
MAATDPATLTLQQRMDDLSARVARIEQCLNAFVAEPRWNPNTVTSFTQVDTRLSSLDQILQNFKGDLNL